MRALICSLALCLSSGCAMLFPKQNAPQPKIDIDALFRSRITWVESTVTKEMKAAYSAIIIEDNQAAYENNPFTSGRFVLADFNKDGRKIQITSNALQHKLRTLWHEMAHARSWALILNGRDPHYWNYRILCASLKSTEYLTRYGHSHQDREEDLADFVSLVYATVYHMDDELLLIKRERFIDPQDPYCIALKLFRDGKFYSEMVYREFLRRLDKT